jgi:hypothetical protein
MKVNDACMMSNATGVTADADAAAALAPAAAAAAADHVLISCYLERDPDGDIFEEETYGEVRIGIAPLADANPALDFLLRHNLHIIDLPDPSPIEDLIKHAWIPDDWTDLQKNTFVCMARALAYPCGGASPIKMQIIQKAAPGKQITFHPSNISITTYPIKATEWLADCAASAFHDWIGTRATEDELQEALALFAKGLHRGAPHTG